jgi:hypothetical protein
MQKGINNVKKYGEVGDILIYRKKDVAFTGKYSRNRRHRYAGYKDKAILLTDHRHRIDGSNNYILQDE